MSAPSQPKEAAAKRTMYQRLERWWTAAATRFLAASALGLLLLLPIAWIGGLVENRENYREQALTQMRQQWGSQAVVATPWLEVQARPKTSNCDAHSPTEASCPPLRRIAIVATTAKQKGKIDSEIRQRGSFSAPVYRAGVDMQLSFDPTQLSEELDVDWTSAKLVLELSDPARLEGPLKATLNQDPLVLDRVPRSGLLPAGAVLEGKLDLESAPKEALQLDLKLSIAGSELLRWLPVARESLLEISSDWSTPAFRGDWLPNQRSIDPDGFRAEWTLAPLARGLPDYFELESDSIPAQLRQSVIVELHEGVSEAQQIERSLKYALLFVVITFGGIWGFEMQTGRILHPLHYLCSGLALCVFFLLELSITEHLGFTLGYSLASLAIVLLLAWYGRGIFGSHRRAWSFAGMVAALFGYLFGVLSHGQSSLLAGSILVFALLAWLMKCTRWIAWHDHVAE